MSTANDAPVASEQSGPIAVYGATGFTGRLIGEELQRRGADFVLAGRNEKKLGALSERLGGAATAVASLDDPASLRRLLEPCAAVIACAGPFTLHGEPVVAAAVDTGTHYIDTTGEQPFMKAIFDRYGERAATARAALVPGMGFDYAPGDMIAALTAEGMGPLEEIAIAYWVRDFAPTQGTVLSALEIMRGGDVVWEDGGWREAPRSTNGGRWRFRDPIGPQRMLRYPAGEQLTVPRHVETRRVRTMLSGMVIPPAIMPLTVATGSLTGLAMRTPLRTAAGALVRRLPEGPNERQRKAAHFVIECEARSTTRTRRGTVRGSDVYGLTAASTVQGAILCAARGYDRAGALAPSEAFDPSDFLAFLSGFGVLTEVDA